MRHKFRKYLQFWRYFTNKYYSRNSFFEHAFPNAKGIVNESYEKKLFKCSNNDNA